MSVLRKYKKNVQKTSLQFEPEMYNNTLGSLIITHYILSTFDEDEIDINSIKKTWKTIRKKGIDFWLDDPDFITKALALFNMEPQYGRFAMCQSALNTLFLPYIDDVVMPIREDGIYPMTARSGKIYPIKEKEDAR